MNPVNERYHGFSLESVWWKYRETFEKTIEGLFEQGLIGSGREKVSREFFDLLKNSGKSGFDQVLKEFLGSINPRTRWIMDLPDIFTSILNLGRELAEEKIYLGISYFNIFGQGGFGNTLKEILIFIQYEKLLLKIDHELAHSFMKGYRRLIDRLAEKEIERYVLESLRHYNMNRQYGLKFLEGLTQGSENAIRNITSECCLEDIKPTIKGMLRALVGYDVEVNDTSRLDANKYVERSTSLVCMHMMLFLPSRIRQFESNRQNRAWYFLLAVITAGMLSEHSFCSIHGHREYGTCKELVGKRVLMLNCFQIVEYTRVVRKIMSQWPGARRLIKFGCDLEYAELQPDAHNERLLFDCLLSGDASSTAVSKIIELSEHSINVFDTASLLTKKQAIELENLHPSLGNHLLQPFSFLPDFMYPGELESESHDSLIENLKKKALKRIKKKDKDKDKKDKKDKTIIREDIEKESSDENETEDEEVEVFVDANFVYDEWCQEENDYYVDYCIVHEKDISDDEFQTMPPGYENEIRQVQRLFEYLKPEIMRHEKRLQDGDIINIDTLINFLVQRHVEPFPRIDFFEKPLIDRRDLSVLILIDVSGSTRNAVEDEKVIDIEKRAAVIFGEGLNSLGDKFSICGFTGTNRENCEYFIYKDFNDTWDNHAKNRILCARPRSSTRIGAALRHTGFRLSSMENRQKLIILITDGKPMDVAYDQNSGYAQYDVRKACEENARKDIHTFAISTTENTRADMEIMFPRGRFVILSDIRQLPYVLPRLYIKMTV